MALLYPLINSNRYDFSSVEININGQTFKGVKSISYKESLPPGKVYGASAMKLGRSRGQYDPTGSLEIFKEEWEALRPVLAATPPLGYMEASFQIVVMYAELAAPVAVDTLLGCRISDIDETHSSGSDALTVKCDLDIMLINRGGTFAVSPPALLK